MIMLQEFWRNLVEIRLPENFASQTSGIYIWVWKMDANEMMFPFLQRPRTFTNSKYICWSDVHSCVGKYLLQKSVIFHIVKIKF